MTSSIVSSVGSFFQGFFSFLQWWIVIAPWEMALRVRLGKKAGVLGPGIHLRIPGLDRFFVQSVRKRYMNTPTQTVTTQDGKIVTVSGGLGYTVQDIEQLYQTLSDPEDVLQLEAMSLIAKIISSSDYAALSIKSIQDHVNQELDLSRYGLGASGFLLSDFFTAKTYRLINQNPKDYGSYTALNTLAETKPSAG